MNEQTISAAILEKYPPLEEAKIDELLRREIQESPVKIIVLDDDPTGVQTVHDVSVYTDWDEESIRNGLEEKNKLFYILTNSRGLTEEQTIQVHRTIAENIAKAAEKAGVPFLMMSRSDSTLRGHYPTEPMVLKEVLEEKTGLKLDGEILCPFFKEGGRFTINDVQSRRPSGLRKTRVSYYSLAHRTTWLRPDFAYIHGVFHIPAGGIRFA